ncbi:MAG: xanthine dehydrogenase accessory protein XdhC [Gammaproteobacteria bacterium]|nr:xanthine dehydrogenase accessory protein XdhC [Gammaproteobacteria bacterium]
MSTAEFPVFLFGAGHIGRALVRVLADTPCRITWVDSRDDIFPADLPGNVQTVSDEQPVFEVDAAPPGACFIVMTHDHQLDGRLCERILRRGDYAWCGLIGSGSKRRKLEKRLRQVGITEQAIKSLVCPIGINGISGKQPQVIAIAVAAQLLAVREAVTHTDTYCTAHPG